jgi:hypothetical protein
MSAVDPPAARSSTPWSTSSSSSLPTISNAIARTMVTSGDEGNYLSFTTNSIAFSPTDAPLAGARAVNIFK